MLTGIYKLLFVSAVAGACGYSMSILGAGMWAWLLLLVAGFVLVSVFVPSLDHMATILGKISGLLAVLALALLLLAATVGGSFRMSESNAIFAVLLVLVALFGLAAFFWENRGAQ